MSRAFVMVFADSKQASARRGHYRYFCLIGIRAPLPKAREGKHIIDCRRPSKKHLLSERT